MLLQQVVLGEEQVAEMAMLQMVVQEILLVLHQVKVTTVVTLFLVIVLLVLVVAVQAVLAGMLVAAQGKVVLGALVLHHQLLVLL